MPLNTCFFLLHIGAVRSHTEVHRKYIVVGGILKSEQAVSRSVHIHKVVIGGEMM